jgi:hypothetical protein
MINVKQAFDQAVNESFESDLLDIITNYQSLEKIANNQETDYDILMQQGP